MSTKETRIIGEEELQYLEERLLVRLSDKIAELVTRSHLSTKEVDSSLHKELMDEIKALKLEVGDLKGKVEPAVTFLETMSNNRRGLIWVGITLASIGGVLGGFKAIYHSIFGN